MGLQTILTPQAIEDLRDLVEFIAFDNPTRAVEFGDELLAVALKAGEFPQSHRAVPEIGDAPVREVIYKSYRIIFEIHSESGVVCVLRFWHAARGKPDVSRPAAGQ